MSYTDQRHDLPAEGGDVHPMAELLEASESQHRFERGDVVSGTIVLVGSHEVLIDVGAKTEGILASREFAQMSDDDLEALEVGDEVECLVINPEDRGGNLVLSLAQARLGHDWAEAERLDSEDEIFEVTIGGHNKGGLIAYVGEVRGFIPASQIDRRHAIDRSQVDGSPDSPLADVVGEQLWVKVIEVDRRKNRLILSEQAAMRERRKQSKAELLDTLEEGQVIEGVVTSLADFGAFVDIGGADGLVHLSELSWTRVGHPQDVLELGEEVKVKVISIDRDRSRIGLSLKQMEPQPWADVAERFSPGDVVRGTVTRIDERGAYASLETEIEGIIHGSELSDDDRPYSEVVAVGDELDVRVLSVDEDRKHIGLSLTRASPEYDDEMTPEALAELVSALELEASNRQSQPDSEEPTDEESDEEAGTDGSTPTVEAAEPAADGDSAALEAASEGASDEGSAP